MRLYPGPKNLPTADQTNMAFMGTAVTTGSATAVVVETGQQTKIGEIAKEASDMVITDDNFASVYAAVEEGRSSFRNIRMATFFLLSTGTADILIILTALATGWPLPLLPAQNFQLPQRGRLRFQKESFDQ